MDPTTSQSWISAETSADGFLARGLVFIVIMAIAALLAVGFRDGLAAVVRGFRRALARSLVGPERPEWETGLWLCAGCPEAAPGPSRVM